MSLLIISGLSGAGKSLVCNNLEDIGYFCIDNLPPKLLIPVCRLQLDNRTTKNMAIVVDSRSQEMFESFITELDALKQQGIDYQLIFINCERDTLLTRFKQTRRKHPLVSAKLPSLERAINKEIEICLPVMERADIVIDTTHLKAGQLRQNIIDAFKDADYGGMTIKLISFGYRNGIPNESDLVYDVRCLPNPFYIEELKHNSGLDDNVYEYVFGFEQSVSMAEKIMDFLYEFIPYYQREGKNELVVSIGCTSGHHRSVSFVRYIEEKLKKTQYRTVIVHRDIDKEY
ncbi:MAG: RNase adapter RapZ [Erysipelotrichaceae bacterium]|nr:RNase adapter RapZ [Erysipelotrichaceae bacterium]MBR2546181.1 RNase adapter RapZ [Erysipelotrichaceae bacterium]MBR2745869.1 RNase adapter RapZ [Erysipelotrichaceae bacterium]